MSPKIKTSSKSASLNEIEDVHVGTMIVMAAAVLVSIVILRFLAFVTVLHTRLKTII